MSASRPLTVRRAAREIRAERIRRRSTRASAAANIRKQPWQRVVVGSESGKISTEPLVSRRRHIDDGSGPRPGSPGQQHDSMDGPLRKRCKRGQWAGREHCGPIPRPADPQGRRDRERGRSRPTTPPDPPPRFPSIEPGGRSWLCPMRRVAGPSPLAAMAPVDEQTAGCERPAQDVVARIPTVEPTGTYSNRVDVRDRLDDLETRIQHDRHPPAGG